MKQKQTRETSTDSRYRACMCARPGQATRNHLDNRERIRNNDSRVITTRSRVRNSSRHTSEFSSHRGATRRCALPMHKLASSSLKAERGNSTWGSSISNVERLRESIGGKPHPARGTRRGEDGRGRKRVTSVKNGSTAGSSAWHTGTKVCGGTGAGDKCNTRRRINGAH